MERRRLICRITSRLDKIFEKQHLQLQEEKVNGDWKLSSH
jgi:hypothetical protein